MQWVCSKREKHHGLKVDHEANLVIKGSNDCPRSDNLAKVQGNLKVFLAVAANVGFDVIKFITGHEFKQRSTLKKEVIVEPPPEYKHDGMIWVLKKAVNGPYNEVRQSHLRIDEALKQLGCKKVAGDEDMHTYHNEQGELNGLVYSYTEEFYSAGKEEFHDTITDTLQKRFAVRRKDE